MNKKVGITGGIGVGKSYVCKILERMGFPIYYSDKASKRLTNNDINIRNGLIELIGEEVYQHGILNKNLLAEKIFKDTNLLQKVNELIHPIVRLNFQQWAKQQKSDIVFNESALLIETGSYKTFDFITLVVSDRQKRIQRIIDRDGSSPQEVYHRMDKQLSDKQKIAHADFVIYNNEEPLLVQIEEMIEKIKANSNI